MATAKLNFHVTREETILISAIIRRAAKLMADDEPLNRLESHMDLSACIANGCPLKLQEMLDAPDFDFAHDFYGIRRHINRQTGQLEDHFLPRFAK